MFQEGTPIPKPRLPRRASSRGEPVVQSQARDILIISGVVRHQREVVNKGDRSDQQVQSADRDADLEQLGSHRAKLIGTRRVEVQNDHVGQQVVLDSLDGLRPVLPVIGLSVKLTQHDGRDAEAPGVLHEAVHQPGWTLQVG